MAKKKTAARARAMQQHRQKTGRPQPAAGSGSRPQGRPTGGNRADRRRAAQRGGRGRGRGIGRLGPWAAIGIVVVIAAALVIAGIMRKSPKAATSTLAPASVVKTVTSVPASAFSTAGATGQVGVPKALPAGQPALTKGGKPLIVFIGADYCPFCAAERWPLVIALGRFGSFTNLGATESAANDIHPRTQTFSFHGATYSSAYVAFEGVETETNQPLSSGSGYTSLDTPTAAQQALVARYDVAPYTSQPGAIPFADFGNRYVSIGTSIDPSLLGGLSLQQIAQQAADPTTAIGKSALVSANLITAAICKITGGQPGSVCSAPEIAKADARLKAGA